LRRLVLHTPLADLLETKWRKLPTALSAIRHVLTALSYTKDYQ
jgi:hypothetical protein